MEAPPQELSLRAILDTLKRQWVWVLMPPALLVAVASLYGFFLAKPIYASTATISVVPVQIPTQLEEQDQPGVQAHSFVPFPLLKSMALSKEVMWEVWEGLRRGGELPARWQGEGRAPVLDRMAKDFRIAEETPSPQTFLVASLTVQAPTPEVAARAANLWAEAVVKRVNAILRTRLDSLEKQLASLEKAYHEARAQWEAFKRASTLVQDRAEIEALTGEGLVPEGQRLVVLEARLGERVLLRRELAGLERNLAAVRSRIRFLEQEVKRSDSEFPELRKELISARLKEAELLAEREVLKNQIANVEGRIALLRDRIARAEVEEDRLKQALESTWIAYQNLRQVRVRLDEELAASGGEIARIVAPAYPMHEMVAPKRGLILALAFSLGLGLGVMAAFVAEALRAPRPEAAAG